MDYNSTREAIKHCRVNRVDNVVLRDMITSAMQSIPTDGKKYADEFMKISRHYAGAYNGRKLKSLMDRESTIVDAFLYHHSRNFVGVKYGVGYCDDYLMNKWAEAYRNSPQNQKETEVKLEERVDTLKKLISEGLPEKSLPMLEKMREIALLDMFEGQDLSVNPGRYPLEFLKRYAENYAVYIPYQPDIYRQQSIEELQTLFKQIYDGTGGDFIIADGRYIPTSAVAEVFMKELK